MSLGSKVFITISALLLLLAGNDRIYTFDKQDLKRDVLITVGEKGFSPDFITIEKGGRVTWLNKGERAHWPASNVHPTHFQYPIGGGCIGSLLDTCRPLKRGESFSFVFDEPGEWGLHDHLYPGLTMSVEVVSSDSVSRSEKLIDKILYQVNQIFVGNREDISYFRGLDSHQAQLNVIKKISLRDPVDAWGFLKKAIIIDGAVVGKAHTFAHVIGNELYRKFGLEGIRYCDSTFAYGCFHGVTEKMLLIAGRESVKIINEQCSSLYPISSSDNFAGCIHGLGHGLLAWEAYNLKPALLSCDDLPFGHRRYCYEGVFMEYSQGAPSVSMSYKNPWDLCNPLEDRYKEACARYLAPLMIKMYGLDVRKTSDGCYLSDNNFLREACLITLGNYVAQMNLGNPDKIKETCASIEDKSGEYICLKSAAIEVQFQRYPNNRKVAEILCQSIPPNIANDCYLKDRFANDK